MTGRLLFHRDSHESVTCLAQELKSVWLVTSCFFTLFEHPAPVSASHTFRRTLVAHHRKLDQSTSWRNGPGHGRHDFNICNVQPQRAGNFSYTRTWHCTRSAVFCSCLIRLLHPQSMPSSKNDHDLEPGQYVNKCHDCTWKYHDQKFISCVLWICIQTKWSSLDR